MMQKINDRVIFLSHFCYSVSDIIPTFVSSNFNLLTDETKKF